MNNSVIHPDARIGKNVQIGPFCYIAANVEIGDNSVIGPHVTILDYVKIGSGCSIHSGAVIGGVPQDLKFQGEISHVEIGDNTVIREYVTVNRGTAASGKGITRIGSGCLIMSYVHVAHDCTVGDNSILSGYVGLAGEVDIEDNVVIGGGTLCHQFVRIGAHAMVGGALAVVKDIPPYALAGRTPVTFEGVNRIGLRRRGFSPSDIDSIHEIYRNLYSDGLNVSDACLKIRKECPESEYRERILAFVESSKRGIIR